MGKGGSVPKAPDMGKQIGNANQTYQTATSNAAQTMNTAKAYNANAQKNLASMTGNNNGAANALMGMAGRNLQTYGSSFIPLQQQQAAEARKYTSGANQEAQEGMAEANVNQSFDAQRRANQQALESEGVDPASIHGAALDAQQRVRQAAAAAGAGTQAYQQNIATGYGMENQANQLGMQVGQQGTAGKVAGAGVNTNTQGAINSTNNTGVNDLTAGNTYLNTGVNATQAATSAQNAQFQDQLAAEQAAAAQGPMASLGALAGDAAGIAGMAMMERGGPVPHGAIPMPTSYRGGGPVSGRGALPVSPIPGSTDTKPALLTPEEFVIPRDAATWKGHEYWYKQIDKARQERAVHAGIPPHHAAPAAHTARGV